MKKIFLLLIASFLIHSSSTSALDWAYWFVVHNGKVYEVKEDMPISQSELGNVIGKVETNADQYSGDYYGNASNYYEIGTRYFEIVEISTNEAIAVETNLNQYVKAVYVHDAPLQIKNVLFSVYTWIILGIGVISLGIVVLRSKQL